MRVLLLATLAALALTAALSAAFPAALATLFGTPHHASPARMEHEVVRMAHEVVRIEHEAARVAHEAARHAHEHARHAREAVRVADEAAWEAHGAVRVVRPERPAVASEAFEGVVIRGGGRVTLRHGREHRAEWDDEDTEVVIEDGTLTIQCRQPCTGRRRDVHVRVTAPAVERLAIQGGGRIEVEPGFPKGNRLAARVQGGGHVDAAAYPVREAEAAVQGGGTIVVAAELHLRAHVQGGGRIAYHGDPEVERRVQGGGTVTRAR